MDEEEKVVQRKPRAKFTLDHLQVDFLVPDRWRNSCAFVVQHSALGLDEVYENFQGYFESKPLQQGREGQDLTRLLCLYQNWQKNLYPYCSLDVFIQKLEAMGHTKECQVRSPAINSSGELPPIRRNCCSSTVSERRMRFR